MKLSSLISGNTIIANDLLAGTLGLCPSSAPGTIPLEKKQESTPRHRNCH